MIIRVGALYSHLSRLSARRLEQSGFLLGRASRGEVEVYAYVPVANTAESPVRFVGDPWDTIVAHNIADNMGVEVVAVFHTHPCCSARPSLLDLDGMRKWPIPWVISGRDGLRGWILKSGAPVEIGIVR